MPTALPMVTAEGRVSITLILAFRARDVIFLGNTRTFFSSSNLVRQAALFIWIVESGIML